MKLEERTVGDVVVLAVTGDLTMNGTWETPLADTVRRASEAGHHRFVIDLARVRYVDSIGLGELAQTLAIVRTRGGALKLLHVTKRMVDLLRVTNLALVFEYFDRESEALASFPSVRRQSQHPNS